MVVFDPRYTETASQASEHHFIRPGTDALVLVTIIQEVMAMDRDRPGGLAPHLDGIQEVLEAIKRVDTSELEARTGVSRSVCRTIADEFSKAPHAVCYGRCVDPPEGCSSDADCGDNEFCRFSDGDPARSDAA